MLTTYDADRSRRPNPLWMKLGGVGLLLLLSVCFVVSVKYHRNEIKKTVALKTGYALNPSSTVNVGVTEVLSDYQWSWLTGRAVRVTMIGIAQSKHQKIQYASFAYRALDDPEWTVVEASKLKGAPDYYRVRMWDLKRRTDYVCCLIATTKEGSLQSEPVRFSVE